MLDSKLVELLKILNIKCSQNGYTIISIDELILEFPTRFSVDGDLIKQMISYLSQQNYITLRYDRDGEFCLSLTIKGRHFYEELPKVEKTEKVAITGLLPHFYNFLAIFFGVSLAFILSTLILKAVF